MTPDVEALLNKARESLEAARLLKREGFLNFAASRAYYAMLYAVEALLLDKGYSYSSHSAVLAAFGREFVKTGALDRRLHRYLLDARDLRNVGDYDLHAQISDAQVSDLLSWGQDLIAAAESILTPPVSRWPCEAFPDEPPRFCGGSFLAAYHPALSNHKPQMDTPPARKQPGLSRIAPFAGHGITPVRASR